MAYDIAPQPDPPEQEAILAALSEEDESTTPSAYVSAWRREALAGDDD